MQDSGTRNPLPPFPLDRYGQLDFTTELIRLLADLDVHADVPLVKNKTKQKTTCVHYAFYYSCYDQGKTKL